MHIEEHVVVPVRSEPDPQNSPEGYVDDGSTSAFRANAYLVLMDGPDSQVRGDVWLSASGAVSRPNDEIGGKAHCASFHHQTPLQRGAGCRVTALSSWPAGFGTTPRIATWGSGPAPAASA